MAIVTSQEIKNAFLKANVDFDINTLKADVAFREQGVDSLDFATLLLSIEEAFGVSIPDDKMESLQTIDQICSFVVEHTA
ncbi:mannose-1-phosphate guanylyltransferase (GDP) [Stutzerimonas stutzeri DSM 10701]|uniref:acyl carrier protein n=1 Tax=Stutzerimonas nitrititolerans TaxID=2482751 RepID=UPI00026D7CF9|nr:phosphopantetheine-binding protein [Stutzerimonas nitrititolerans]AFN78738.1 mannose-1-phosphate guanylyltransferase (GDP) [Stutzerimonas stutzeri DSM 10701]SUD84093.1 mannose-1-phosphate guanylyltransferase (GDP) [Stutzerimonas stutzeri]